MSQFKTDIYLIHCLTPLHAGSGDTNYGEIDKLVQRDPTNDLPTIYSSALKGALREYCKDAEMPDLDKIFGSMGSDENQSTGTSKQRSEPGKCRFFSADLLCLPVQGLKKPYYLTTALSVITEMNQKMQALKADFQWQTACSNTEDVLNYDISGKKLNASLLKDNDVYMLTNFYDDAAKKLPVIARNHLENGESQNLWYEEIVPRETRFVCAIAAPSADSALLKTLENTINNQTVHIGAHASIGYGYCKITKLN